MRTPIQSMIGMAEFILKWLLRSKPSKDKDRMVKYIKLIIMQLKFVESFTEDMLNINMIHGGVFELAKTDFSPQEAFYFVSAIFEQKLTSKNVALIFMTVS